MTKRVTLSFDNGPDPETTPLVLDILARRGIRTTFFVIGEKLRDPARHALAARAHAEGHWIGNHTFHHLAPLGASRFSRAPEWEIGRTQELIGDLAHPDLLFRPFGSGGILDDALLSPAAVDYLCRGGFTCVLWTVIPRDWEDPEGWVERALEMCAAEDWPLVVIHDIATTAMDRLDDFLDALDAAGYSIEQDFPPDCVPIRRGEIVADLSAIVRTEPSA